jgi:hypothetical protein
MKRFTLISILLIFGLAGCGTLGVQIGLTPDGPRATPAVTTGTALPPVVGQPPTPTEIPAATLATLATLAVTETVPASDPPSPSQPPVVATATDTAPANDPPATLLVKIFLIAVEDQGKSGDPVGCGDSAVAAQVEIPYTQGVLKAAIERLMALKDQNYGQSGLYNALYQSDLRLDSVTIKDSTATVNLSGTLKLGGECDNPRVESQLTQTALQFSTVSQVSIFINGKPLKDALSLKQ